MEPERQCEQVQHREVEWTEPKPQRKCEHPGREPQPERERRREQKRQREQEQQPEQQR
jgi:hypothetical protein